MKTLFGSIEARTPSQRVASCKVPLTEDETENLPIIMIDLIPNADHIPKNLNDVRNRMAELSFENRFWDEYGGHKGLADHARVLNEINELIPADHSVRREREFQRMMKYCACKNLNVITPIHQAMSEGHDFSPGGISHRYQSGVNAARTFLESEFGKSRESKTKRQRVSSAAVLVNA